MITKKERLLRVGVLGCGPIAQFAHLEACQKARNVELYAICDGAQDLTRKMAAIYEPAVVYQSYEHMLADPNVEAIILAVSDAFHVNTALMALQAGKHVLVEKPLGSSIRECLQLEQAVQKAGVQFQVAHMKRFDPGIAFAKKFIDERIGQILALKAWYCDSTHRYTVTDNVQPLPYLSKQAIKPSFNEKADKERYFMMAHGSHLLDTARFLCGSIESVQAKLTKKFGAYCWFVDTEFANGAAGHLDLTVAVRMDWHEGFTLYGEHGSVLGTTPNPWYFKSSHVECFSEEDGQYHRVLGADAHFYRLQVEGFADSILKDKPQVGTTIGEGIESVQGMIAISESVRRGKRIYLKDLPVDTL
jgi:predicted dehydrogenase